MPKASDMTSITAAVLTGPGRYELQQFARPDLADGALKAALESVGDELRFVFITSGARVANAADRPAGAKQCDGFWVSVVASTAGKCVRCWHRRPDVGAIAGHETICGRCADNVDGAGEVRRYA